MGGSTVERKIDGLVDQIYEEGIEKAKHEAEAILAEARQEAQALREGAERDRARILGEAQSECDALRENTLAELKSAGARTVTDLQARLRGLLVKSLMQGPVKAAGLEVEFMHRLLLELVRGSQNGTAGDSGWLATLPDELKAEWEERLRGALGTGLDNLEVSYSKGLQSGFKVARTGEAYELDFTEEALTAFFRDFLKEETARLLFG